MARAMRVVVALVLAAAVVSQANPCSSGSECASDIRPSNVASLLERSVHMGALNNGGEDNHCSIGGECQSDDKPQYVVTLLQTKLRMKAPVSADNRSTYNGGAYDRGTHNGSAYNGGMRAPSADDRSTYNGGSYNRGTHTRTQLTSVHAAVVLQLPHDLGSGDECFLNKIRLARSQLPANYNLICFWWTDEGGAQKNWSTSSLTELHDACDQKLITFDTDVLPQSKSIIEALKSSLPSGHWQWWYADVAFILSYHAFRDSYFANVDMIWYMEDDVQFTGNLGNILLNLQPDTQKYGYGIHSHDWSNCRTRNWHLCVPVDTFIDKNVDYPHGRIQMVWYSPRLLDQLFQHLQSSQFAYCEAFAPYVCSNMGDCEIDDFGARGANIFQQYWCGCCASVTPTDENHIAHPVKECPSELYASTPPARQLLDADIDFS